MTITESDLSAIFSKGSPLDKQQLLDTLNIWLPSYKVNTKLRVAAFLAQIAHETGNFKWLTELGRVSYFNKYEPGTKIGRRLGNSKRGDGAKFRGRGLIQLTGRYNYTKFNKYLRQKKFDPVNVIRHPKVVSRLPYALIAALWYWKVKGLNKYADNGDFRTLTKRINGGLNGYRDRLNKYNDLMQRLLWV